MDESFIPGKKRYGPSLLTVAGCGVLLGVGLVVGLVLGGKLDQGSDENSKMSGLCIYPWAQQETVPPEMHVENRIRAAEIMHQNLGRNATLSNSALFYLQGAASESTFFASTEKLFRQESNFIHQCQYALPYAVGVISAECVIELQVSEQGDVSQRATLFVQRPDSRYAVWDGRPYTLEELRATYQVERVFWREDMPAQITELEQGGRSRLYTVPGANLTLSAARVQLARFTLNTNTLLPAISGARAIKNPGEVQLVRTSTQLSSKVHAAVMLDGQTYDHEYQVGYNFRRLAASCSHQRNAYLAIAPASFRTSILHYNNNFEPINRLTNDLMLLDAGSESRWGYGTDITRTWPVNGRYTAEQETIYNIVLYAQDVALALLRDGQNFGEVGRNASGALLDGLMEAGIVTGTYRDALAANMQSVFYPHSLGHSVGIDVHDPGRTEPLRQNMILTVEPGIYFIDPLIEEALVHPVRRNFLDTTVLARYRNWQETSLGGVRIEDVALVTQNGWELLSGDSPRHIDDYNRFMETGEFIFSQEEAEHRAQEALRRFRERVNVTEMNEIWRTSPALADFDSLPLS